MVGISFTENSLQRLPVTSPSDFNNVVEAFEFPEFSYLGGRAPRTQIIGRVYTANESPLDKRIPFHHEYPEFVAKLVEHGLTYITVTRDEDDASAIGGTGWKSAYMTDDKNIAEERKLDLQGSKVRIKDGMEWECCKN
ncbi:hypothetical protein L1987_45259 [Smallanthus sonchifolius]|uniref:Uncharacterized protein n=1 Tax=Smallanthus sonchifolius TaxID=185202 RepID=A0ACB9GRG8_9ASTR|nr:hypothetical protein L1987_45259 [Smallanthus sonchifolius]